MSRTVCAGAVGLVAPSGLIGRLISKRQGVPYSHAIICVGPNSKNEIEVFDSTWPWARIKPLEYWKKKKVTWWAPLADFDDDETRRIRSAAKFAEGRVGYGVWQLVKFLILGVPGKRSHHLFCTYAVAELYMQVRNLDFTGCEQPYNIDIRETLVALQRGPFVMI